MRASDVTARSHEFQLRSGPEARAAPLLSNAAEETRGRGGRPGRCGPHTTGDLPIPAPTEDFFRVERRTRADRERRSGPECLKSETVLRRCRHAHGGGKQTRGRRRRRRAGGDRRGGCSFPHAAAAFSHARDPSEGGRGERLTAHGRRRTGPGAKSLPPQLVQQGGDPISSRRGCGDNRCRSCRSTARTRRSGERH